jgi:hypothetical protein
MAESSLFRGIYKSMQRHRDTEGQRQPCPKILQKASSLSHRSLLSYTSLQASEDGRISPFSSLQSSSRVRGWKNIANPFHRSRRIVQVQIPKIAIRSKYGEELFLPRVMLDWLEVLG